MGYSRQQFYAIRPDFQFYGADGLLDRLPGPMGPHHNRVTEEVQRVVLDDLWMELPERRTGYSCFLRDWGTSLIRRRYRR